MLRPEQIRIHRFTPTNKGTYRAEDVDGYMNEVLASYEQMFRENGELVRKMSLLAERLEEYRNDEDNIRAALLTAQRMADKIQKDATEQTAQQLTESAAAAERAVTQAQQKAQAMLAETQQKTQALFGEAQQKTQTMLTESKIKSENAVVSAKAEAARIMNEVEQTAQTMIVEAGTKAREITRESTVLVEREKLVLENMRSETTAFRTELLDAYRHQIRLIEALPEIVAAEQREEVTAAEALAEALYTPTQPEPAMQQLPEAEAPAAIEQQLPEAEAPAVIEQQLPEANPYDIYIAAPEPEAAYQPEPMYRPEPESAYPQEPGAVYQPEPAAAIQPEPAVAIQPEPAAAQNGGFRISLDALNEDDGESWKDGVEPQPVPAPAAPPAAPAQTGGESRFTGFFRNKKQ